MHDGGVYEYGSLPGPTYAGLRLPVVHDHSAACAVPSGLRNDRTRSTVELFLGCTYHATCAPLVLLSAPLTALTATSEPEGLLSPCEPAPPLSLEHASAPQARRPHERNDSAREGFMVEFS